MTNISREAVEEAIRSLDLAARQSGDDYLRHIKKNELRELITALRDALDHAHKSGWDDAIEAAVGIEGKLAKSLAHFVRIEAWSSYRDGVWEYQSEIRALPYKPQEDVSDG